MNRPFCFLMFGFVQLLGYVACTSRKRSINPILVNGFIFRKQVQKLASSSTATVLRNLRCDGPLAGVRGCGATRRKALAH